MADETDIVVEHAEPRVATVDPRPLPASPRISWGAIFGGAIAALGLWLLLYAFGLAVGLSSIDPNNPHSARGSGIFTGVWGGIAPLIALFIGGVLAARLAGVVLRSVGAMHGLIMWGLVAVAGALMVFSVVSGFVADAAAVGPSVAQDGGEAAIRGALKAANVTGKAFWGVFGALALGLVAALGGGMLGVPRVRVLRAPEPGPRNVVTEAAPRGPIMPPREAYRRT